MTDAGVPERLHREPWDTIARTPLNGVGVRYAFLTLIARVAIDEGASPEAADRIAVEILDDLGPTTPRNAETWAEILRLTREAAHR